MYKKEGITRQVPPLFAIWLFLFPEHVYIEAASVAFSVNYNEIITGMVQKDFIFIGTHVLFIKTDIAFFIHDFQVYPAFFSFSFYHCCTRIIDRKLNT